MSELGNINIEDTLINGPDKSKDPNPKIEQPASILSRLFGDRKALTGTLSAGLLAFGISTSEALAEEKQPVPPLTPELTETVSNVMGMPVEEINENYYVRVPVLPDENNLWVVSASQIHSLPLGSRYFTPRRQEIAIKNQKEIYEIAQSTIEANNLPCVFYEGITDERFPHELKETIETSGENLDQLYHQDINSPEQLDNSLRTITVLTMSYQLDNRLYHYLQPKIEKLKIKLQSSIQKGITSIAYPQEIISEMIKPSSFKEKPDQYYAGAPFKLLMDRKVDKLCPTSDEELEKQTETELKKAEGLQDAYSLLRLSIEKELSQAPQFKESIDRYNALVNKMKEKGRESITPEEFDESVKTYTTIENRIDNDPRIREAKRILDDARASYVNLMDNKRIESIFAQIDYYDKKEAAGQKKPKNVLVVYGAGHDLASGLSTWNAQNPPNAPDRGMIELIPKDIDLLRKEMK